MPLDPQQPNVGSQTPNMQVAKQAFRTGNLTYPDGIGQNTRHKHYVQFFVNEQSHAEARLGIGAYEGSLVGALPLVPDRLSYYEMYTDDFKYPNECTINHSAFQENSKVVVDKIKDMIENYDEYKLKNTELQLNLDAFFNGSKLYQAIKDSVDAV